MDEVNDLVGDWKFGEVAAGNFLAGLQGHEVVGTIEVRSRPKGNARDGPGILVVGRFQDPVEFTIGANGNFAVRIEGGMMSLDEGARTEGRRHAIAVRDKAETVGCSDDRGTFQQNRIVPVGQSRDGDAVPVLD